MIYGYLRCTGMKFVARVFLPAIAITFLQFMPSAYSQSIDEYMDMQIHPTIHIPHPVFDPGLTYFDPSDPPDLKHKHLMKNVNYANYWEANPGCRIFVIGFMTKESIRNPHKARKQILEQMEYVENFVRKYDEKFAIARSPEEVRSLVARTNKTIIMYSLEGAKALIGSEEDAKFWAEKGVAFVTLMHLLESELGGSAIRPGIIFKLINPKGVFRNKKNRGLTPLGKNAIVWLANAGILTDISHMSDETRRDALDLMIEKGIPPLSTHDGLRPLQNMERAILEEDIIRIYQAKGLMALPVSGISLRPFKPDEEFKKLIENKTDYCNGSVDTYRFTYESLKSILEKNVSRIFNDSTKSIDDLNEEERIDLAIGFETDFNGYVNHSRPRYGHKGCFELQPNHSYEAIEVQGLAHPGLLDSQWKWMAKQGVDLAPIKRASEKFLRMWEKLRKKDFNISIP